MTVGELIEELQKHPGHHTVMLVGIRYYNGIRARDDDRLQSVVGVEYKSHVDGPGCTVNIMGEP